MHTLGHVASVLAAMPGSPDRPGVNAGLSFTMLRGVEPFYTGAVENLLIMERLRELAGGARTASRVAPALKGIASKIEKIARIFARARR